MNEEEELKRFPQTDSQFTDGGGIIWTPRELSDFDVQNSIDLLNYHFKEKTAKKGDRQKLNALVAEKMRREIRLNAGQDAEIGRDICIQKAGDKLKAKTPAPEKLILEIRTASGVIWGQAVLMPRKFSTGSTGYFVSDRFRDPSDWSKFQLSANIVRVGSRALQPS